MCFPFLFRAALDSMASEINEDMKMAAAKALANLTHEPVPQEVKAAFPGRSFEFGPEYIIPTPFDPRLITALPIPIAQAAMDSGVSKAPIRDMNQYKQRLLAGNF